MNLSEPLENREKVDQGLAEYAGYWQLRPFEYLDLPWRDSHPDLCRWLEELSLEEINAIDSDLVEHQAIFSRFFPHADMLPRCCTFPELPVHQSLPINPRLNYRMSDRKWAQILAFSERIQFEEGPIVEWCSGKGHLGRLISDSLREPVLGLEKNPELCRKGALLADRSDVAMAFTALDVLSTDVEAHLHPAQHVLALHACGDLHLRLLQLAVHKQLRAVTVAPCCYHAISTEDYPPLSAFARASRLRITRFDLKLPLQETVVAGRRVRRRRARELSWRLGFDLLQRELSGGEHYRSLPSIRASVLSGTFEQFCRWAAQRLKLELPANLNFETYRQLGVRRRLNIARIELVRHLFRRPLEYWLLMDCAAYLSESGYHVEIGRFCPKKTTPRNVMIRARRL